ncbi:hypothetical protein [Burkholderia diffusa]|uniref:hypothetical protein n=1 Tax=Burkholderia diffusa TaxID=488732 RepID=UPI0012DA494A|nr:hypothetical protein [Burkholderia diffusa]
MVTWKFDVAAHFVHVVFFGGIVNIPLRVTVLAVCACIFTSGALGKMVYPVALYLDKHVGFIYPSNLYKKVAPRSESTFGGKLYFYDLVRRDDGVVDSITVCGESLSTCADTENQTMPYWLDADDGRLAIFNITSTVTHRETRDGDVYEAFPLCPSTDKRGRSDPYGGECYAAVKATWNKTYSLVYWLGTSENVRGGVVRTQAIDRARKILDSLGHAEQSTKVVKQIVVTTDGVQCPIRLVDPYDARVTETRYVLDHFPYRRTGLGELYLQFECVNSNDAEAIRSIVPASFDENGKQWKEDFSALSAEDLALLKPVTRIFPLEAANSTGIAATQEQVNGDPKTRDRRFAFCLRHPPVMLCGGTAQIARPFCQESDLLPFALTVVKSIEFIDAPDDGARAASAAIPSPAVIPPK